MDRNEAGGNGVHRDAELAEFQGQRLGEPLEAGLRGRSFITGAAITGQWRRNQDWVSCLLLTDPGQRALRRPGGG